MAEISESFCIKLRARRH